MKHPGENIRKQLDIHEMTQVDLAERMGVTYQRVNEILNGKRGISADTALRLEEVFPGTAAGAWMRIQADYDLHRARIAE